MQRRWQGRRKMPSIDDWVAKVAQLIKSELTIEMRDDFVDDGYRCAPDFEVTTTEARIAAFRPLGDGSFASPPEDTPGHPQQYR